MTAPRRRPAQRQTPSPRGTFSVAVASDWAPIRLFDPIVRAEPAAVYGDTLAALREADLRVVNCECALTTATAPVHKSGAVFKGHPDHVAGLTAVPFEVACLANNHVLDYGTAGLRETLRVLQRAGLRTVGAGLDASAAWAPLSLDVRGHRLHIVNVSEGEDETASRGGAGVFGWDVQRAVDTIAACRDDGGTVIVIAHCGLEYVPFAPPYVVEAFRAFADAGAAAVIGHHPHVPQGVEWRGRTPILYSLGNFVFYQPTDLHYRKTGFFATLHFAGDGVEHVDLHPYRITDQGLRALDARAGTAFYQDMARLSQPYQAEHGHLRAWDAYLDHYGLEGFRSEIGGILSRLDSEPEKAAAMFRNRITTMQHVELWRTWLNRRMAGTKAARPPAGARRLVEAYVTRTVPPPTR